ncbi:MAG: cell division protein FtsZ [Hyphomicrobiales bacterium]|nr:cell division protein FtsZ [Hyphomicrobiales bacterium]MCP5371218.1 cell division protein FtsZ [Hyphomicrobiales bacterium]
MTINLSVPENNNTPGLKPRITVVGVGGAGGNAVNNMIRMQLEGVDFVAANTDYQALTQSRTDRRVQLGTQITQGLGAGARADVGRAAAEESIEQIMAELDGSHMVFIAAGMGGGTGTGAAPVIARVARDQGILTVGVVTKPFQFEGAHRMRIAEAGIEELEQYVDTLIIIPNQNLFRIANEKTTFADAFTMADDVLYSGVRGVTDLMVMPGLINLDFADVRSVMSEMGKAMMGTGEADGERRALDAAEAAIANPLLDDTSMKGAKGVLINITGGADMTLFEVDEAANRIRAEVDQDAYIIFGSTFDESLEGKMRVSVVATGMDAAEIVRPQPAMPHVVDTMAPPAPVEAPAPAPEPIRDTLVVTQAAPRPVAAQRPDTSRFDVWKRPQTRRVDIPAKPAAHIPPAAPAAPAAAPVATPVAPPQAAVPQAPAAPEPAPEPVAERVAPEPVAERPAAPQPAAQQPFIPPLAAGRQDAGAGRRADPFAAAAMTNGPRAGDRDPAPARPAETAETRAPSLFERVTGTGRAAKPKADKGGKLELLGFGKNGRDEPAAPEAAEPAAEAPQGRLGGLDPKERISASKSEEDLLDIPAFLRRQAN